ncbi:MAG: hypothetical protein ACR2N5_08170 [Solirubrobacterales bacterium]
MIAVVALVAALGGSAVAEVASTSLSKKDKKQVTKIAKKQGKKQGKKQANKQIEKKAPGLSVAEAANAETLDGNSPGDFASSSSEPYRVIGTPGQPGLVPTWAPVAAKTPPGFYKDPFGVVHLRGSIDSGTSGSIAFVLPPAYAPASATTLEIPIYQPGAGAAAAVIAPDGSVLVFCHTGPSCEVSFSGATYRS